MAGEVRRKATPMPTASFPLERLLIGGEEPSEDRRIHELGLREVGHVVRGLETRLP
jgi:hypothetical protein